MATSGSVNFASTRNEIIQDAYQLIGVYGIGYTISAEDMALAVRVLNRMLKSWQAKGIHMWQKKEAYLFLEPSVGLYTLGSASSAAYMCDQSDANLTTISANEAAAQTTISVTDSTGMVANDFCVIELDDGSAHQTTISSVPGATSIIINDALPSAASATNNVYTFTTRINKPLEIINARRKSTVGTDSTAVPLRSMTQEEFMRLPNRNTDGTPTHYYFNPGLTDSELRLYQRPDSAAWHLEVTYRRMIEDMDAAGDTFDFPVEWENCIVYQLAHCLGPHFQVDVSNIEEKASRYLYDLSVWDTEDGTIKFSPKLKNN